MLVAANAIGVFAPWLRWLNRNERNDNRPAEFGGFYDRLLMPLPSKFSFSLNAQFDPDTFWPGHPSDDGVRDGNPSFYTGAAGVIWALDYLHRIGATGVAAVASQIAWVLFVIGIILLIVHIISGRRTLVP